eukprot:1797150-Pyramimonas_sp.AAC.1
MFRAGVRKNAWIGRPTQTRLVQVACPYSLSPSFIVTPPSTSALTLQLRHPYYTCLATCRTHPLRVPILSPPHFIVTLRAVTKGGVDDKGMPPMYRYV